ncbi:hypothetical protein DFH09DRAFT_1280425 [Mycena vulgaris]|nr:hypothetical protein DFH09DRAFT_1280425 [Mycena vulgaris]
MWARRQHLCDARCAAGAQPEDLLPHTRERRGEGLDHVLPAGTPAADTHTLYLLPARRERRGAFILGAVTLDIRRPRHMIAGPELEARKRTDAEAEEDHGCLRSLCGEWGIPSAVTASSAPGRASAPRIDPMAAKRSTGTSSSARSDGGYARRSPHGGCSTSKAAGARDDRTWAKGGLKRYATEVKKTEEFVKATSGGVLALPISLRDTMNMGRIKTREAGRTPQQASLLARAAEHGKSVEGPQTVAWNCVSENIDPCVVEKGLPFVSAAIERGNILSDAVRTEPEAVSDTISLFLEGLSTERINFIQRSTWGGVKDERPFVLVPAMRGGWYIEKRGRVIYGKKKYAT